MWAKFFVLLVLFISTSSGVLSRPRGVSISMATFYNYVEADPYFHCLDSSSKIPYEYINDDYCDCADGSDEPGTSACPNGKYHCTNAGHTPFNIMSSRVNDGICDCCDGTDEYEEIIKCSNNCRELGKLAREEAEKEQILMEEGHKTRLEYSREGIQSIKEKKLKVVELEKQLITAKEVKDEAEAKKNDVEIPEKEAKDTHEKLWNEEKERRDKDADDLKCAEAFNELDINKDGLVDATELALHPEFDMDANGVVSGIEAGEYMSEETEASMDHFVNKMWTVMKDIYKPLSKREPEVVAETTMPPGTTETAPELPAPTLDTSGETDQEDSDNEDDYRDDDDDKHDDENDEEDVNDRAVETEDDDYKVTEDTPKKDKGDKSDDEMPEYDETTKELIQVAEGARSEFQKATDEVKRIETDITDTKHFVELDLGEASEFYPLKGECYELDDKEYTYSLCPFEKASQISKNGGSDTSLGLWGKWSGPDTDIYSEMLYDRGQNCWNGPDRSVRVSLKCGVVNQLISASEPSRCEYHFMFTSPARCLAPASHPHHPHTEL